MDTMQIRLLGVVGLLAVAVLTVSGIMVMSIVSAWLAGAGRSAAGWLRSVGARVRGPHAPGVGSSRADLRC
jgi:hypothetical protein